MDACGLVAAPPADVQCRTRLPCRPRERPRHRVAADVRAGPGVDRAADAV